MTDIAAGPARTALSTPTTRRVAVGAAGALGASLLAGPAALAQNATPAGGS